MIGVPLGRRAFLSGRFGAHLVARTEAVPASATPGPSGSTPVATTELGYAPRFEDERAAFRKRALERLAPRPMRARVDRFACLGSTGQSCSSCVEHCPVPGAIVLDGTIPRIDTDRCDGCGLCERACPAPLGAIRVLPILGTTPMGGAR